MCRLPPRSVTAKYWDILLYPTDRPPIGGLLCCTQWRKEAGSRLAAAGKRGRARAHELEIEHTYETHRHTHSLRYRLLCSVQKRTVGFAEHCHSTTLIHYSKEPNVGSGYRMDTPAIARRTVTVVVA